MPRSTASRARARPGAACRAFSVQGPWLGSLHRCPSCQCARARAAAAPPCLSIPGARAPARQARSSALHTSVSPCGRLGAPCGRRGSPTGRRQTRCRTRWPPRDAAGAAGGPAWRASACSGLGLQQGLQACGGGCTRAAARTRRPDEDGRAGDGARGAGDLQRDLPRLRAHRPGAQPAGGHQPRARHPRGARPAPCGAFFNARPAAPLLACAV
jgi:hypothetical protein